MRILLCLAATVAALAAADPPPLRVGMELGYPPFEMVGADGQAEGVSVEMARALAADLGRPLVIENMSFDGLIPALKTGKIDLIISSMTATEERRKSIAFSEPYVRTGLAILVRNGEEAPGIEALNRAGKRVAVKRGTTGHLYALDHLKNARLLVLDKENTAVLEVAQGRADAFLYDQLSVLTNWKRNRDSTRAILTPFQVEVWAVGLRKGEEDLRDRVNAFLDRYRAQGGFDRLAEKFFPEERREFRELGVEFIL
jgi:polar amino acid transport system substrate-binding protein